MKLMEGPNCALQTVSWLWAIGRLHCSWSQNGPHFVNGKIKVGSHQLFKRPRALLPNIENTRWQLSEWKRNRNNWAPWGVDRSFAASHTFSVISKILFLIQSTGDTLSVMPSGSDTGPCNHQIMLSFIRRITIPKCGSLEAQTGGMLRSFKKIRRKHPNKYMSSQSVQDNRYPTSSPALSSSTRHACLWDGNCRVVQRLSLKPINT